MWPRQGVSGKSTGRKNIRLLTKYIFRNEIFGQDYLK